MAEEKYDNSTTPTSDDLSVLRVLLHTVKGSSSVSTSANYLPVSDGDDAS